MPSSWTDDKISAEITLAANATATVLTAQNTWYLINPASAWAQGVTPYDATVQIASGTITAQVSDRCTISASITATTAATAARVEFAVFKNGVQMTGKFAAALLDATTTPITVPMTGQADLAAGDVLDLRARCTTAAAVSITATNANFNVMS